MSPNYSQRLFDKFDVIECLKKDDGTCVYRAHHIYLDTQILLKTLDKKRITDPTILERFQREAKILAQLQHPNIIRVLDFGTYEQFFYISFEYFKSRTLRDAMSDGINNPQTKLDYMIQIARGLEYAHNNNVIHRDLKPENILVNDRNEVKIADFGLALVHGDASMTAQTSIVGTPSYMSPEQVRGEKLTAQSDLFSFGIIAFELYAGRNPFLGKDVGATLNNILSGKAPCETRPDWPEPVCDVIKATLQRNKKQRAESASEILKRLGAEITLTETEETERPQKTRVSAKKKWIAPAAALLLVVFVAAWMIFNSGQTERSVIIPAAPDSNQQEKVIEKPQEEEIPSTEPEPEKQPVSENAMKEPEQDPMPGFGELFVRCLPWADVFIDTNRIDRTPWESPVKLAAGEYTLRLKHPNYPMHMKNIRITPNETQTVTVDLDSLFGYFVPKIYPWGDVFIDDEFKGQTPLSEPIPVTPGNHRLTIENKSFGKIQENVVIAKQETLYYKLDFERVIDFEDEN